eukprot:13111796-Alexandrium_andersonii.AAC.1
MSSLTDWPRGVILATTVPKASRSTRAAFATSSMLRPLGKLSKECATSLVESSATATAAPKRSSEAFVGSTMAPMAPTWRVRVATDTGVEH